MDKKTTWKGARKRSAEQSGGDDAQGGVGRSAGNIQPRGVLAAREGQRERDVGMDFANAVGSEQGERLFAARTLPCCVE